MRPPILTALAAFATLLVPSAQARMQFLSPPAFDENGSATTRAVRTLGQTLELKWTPAQQGKKLSVVLYQLNATRAASFDGVFHFTEGPFEFITHDQVDATSFTWIVGTTKNLASSSLFSLAVWEEGALDTDSATDVFSIVASRVTTSSSTSSSAPSTTASSTASTTSSSTVAGTTGSESTTSPATANQGNAGGLSTGAAVGVALGTVSGVILFAAAGWWLGRRQRRARRQAEGGAVSLPEDAMGGYGPGQPGMKDQQAWVYHDAAPPVGELEVQQVIEAPGGHDRHELM